MERLKPGMGPRIEVLLAALLFSTGGAAIKACAFSSWQVAGLRSVLAAGMLLVVLPGSRRGWTARQVAVGAAYAATMVMFVTANKLTTAINTIFLQDTAPLYILILSPLLLAEPIRRRDVVTMSIVLAGLAMFFIQPEAPQDTAPNPWLGNVVAAASGLAWALTILGLRWLGRDEGQPNRSQPALVIGNLIACAVCLPLALPIPRGTAQDWLVIAFLGFVQIGMAYLFLSKGLTRVPAFTASILLLIEPVLNPVWAFLIHGERPAAGPIAGSALILAATVIKTWQDRRANARTGA